MTSITGDTCLSVWTIGPTHFACNGASYLTIKNMHFSGGAVAINAGKIITLTDCGFFNTRGSAITNAGGGGLAITNCLVMSGGTAQSGVLLGSGCVVKNSRFVGCSITAAVQINGHNNLFNNCFISAASSSSLYGMFVSTTNNTGGGKTLLRNCVFRRCTLADAGIQAQTLFADNCDFSGGTDASIITNNIPGCDAALMSTNHDQTADNHQQYHEGGKIFSATDERHTASGISWKFTPTSTSVRYSAYPLKTVIATIYCTSGSLVTFSAWLRRSNTGLTMQLYCIDGQLGGPTTEQTSSMTAAADTWEQVTLTWTPTSSGVVEIEGRAYGGSTYSGWIDDIEVTQA